MVISEATMEKYNQLKKNLKALGSVAIAFSAGVDSTFLCKVAKDVLGDHMIAVTASASSMPEQEVEESKAFCKKENIPQVVICHDIFATEGFRENPENRCYLCKKDIFMNLQKAAKKYHMAYVAEGSNMDDLSDYRPGLLAIKELGVKSPLREAGLYKEEIRKLSQMLGLPTWSKPSMACLATRFAYGETITEEKLKMIGQAENFLVNHMGQKQMRVRIHGKIARIEVLPDQIAWIAAEENRKKIVQAFRNYGFDYVTLDLEGYRSGSMNEGLGEDVLKVKL
jgi:uncharacterized protein